MTNENDSRPAYEGGEAQTGGQTIDHNPNEPKIERQTWSLSAKIGVALAAVIGLGAVAAQSAGGFGPHGGGFAGHFVGKALDSIDASTEQEERIKTIIERTRGELEPMRDEFRESRQQLMTLLSAPSVDTAAIEKLRAERIAAIDEASKKAVSAITEAAGVLSPEQRAKLVSEMQDRMGKRW